MTGETLDECDHGTYTASTVARNFVEIANVFGNANGTTAVGIDTALEDGVNVLSMSFGYQAERPSHFIPKLMILALSVQFKREFL
ncbi:hypothetical protein ACH5RR_022961 [Cinchona calisaya]|uniref:Peptidase S8/S53 domain-containing protein n=1 Tax=Cinchona calisaya TaxID=153742 RepID=A0ABD2Z9B6_9GENT